MGKDWGKEEGGNRRHTQRTKAEQEMKGIKHE